MLTNSATIIILVLLAAYILFLFIEVTLHNRRLNSIPVRITVTGTRGKTSVARIIAAILRESGKTVIAKTTGTEAKIILPDGREEDFRGRGPINIIEQKKLVRKAAKLNADILVAEIMSIRPENHKTETFKLLKPHYTVITNLYPDHLDACEDDSMTSLYANDIYPGSKIVMFKNELDEKLSKHLTTKDIELISLDGSSSPEGNSELAYKVSELIGIPINGTGIELKEFGMDRGEVKAYKFMFENNELIFINLFAANDPISSKTLISSIKEKTALDSYKLAALLSMRPDRPERSSQWNKFLKSEGEEIFDEYFYLGSHRHYMKRSLRKGVIINNSDPDIICQEVGNSLKGKWLVFGLVNIGGTGLKLIDYWARTGKEIDF